MTEKEIDYNKYEPVIGLEVHAQMLTKSKAYCTDPYDYGAEPNTMVSPVSLGHPGTLPKHNRQVVNNAIKMGLACSFHLQFSFRQLHLLMLLWFRVLKVH